MSKQDREVMPQQMAASEQRAASNPEREREEKLLEFEALQTLCSPAERTKLRNLDAKLQDLGFAIQRAKLDTIEFVAKLHQRYADRIQATKEKLRKSRPA